MGSTAVEQLNNETVQLWHSMAARVPWGEGPGAKSLETRQLYLVPDTCSAQLRVALLWQEVFGVSAPAGKIVFIPPWEE